MIPGSNLLNQANRLIAFQSCELLPFASQAPNEIGVLVDTYGDPVPITGSVQAIAREVYEQLGLDFESNYIMVYTSAQVRDIGRDRSSDRLRYDGKLFKAVGDSDWMAIDGWNGALFIEVQQEAMPT